MATVTLHALPPSHPCMTAEAALRLKGVEYERVDLTPGAHVEEMTRLYGAHTVPGALFGDEPVHGSRAILAKLEELHPSPVLYPSDAVREAERWGDEELQDLVHRSGGLNLGLDFLPGALMFNPGADPDVDPDEAADVVWFDALVTNPDRTAVNPNLLMWHGRTWLIDHGASLYVHHTWRDPDSHAEGPFERIRDHVLLPFAGGLAEASERLAPRLGSALFDELVAAIPDAWLPDDPTIGDAAAQRRAYVRLDSGSAQSADPTHSNGVAS